MSPPRAATVALVAIAAASLGCGSTSPAPTEQPVASAPTAPPAPAEDEPAPLAESPPAPEPPVATPESDAEPEPSAEAAADPRRRIPDSGRHCIQRKKQRYYPCYALVFEFTDPAVEQHIEEKLFAIWDRVDPLVAKRFGAGRAVDPAEVERVRVKAEPRIRKVLGQAASAGLTRVTLEVFVEDAYEEPEEF